MKESKSKKRGKKAVGQLMTDDFFLLLYRIQLRCSLSLSLSLASDTNHSMQSHLQGQLRQTTPTYKIKTFIINEECM
jgi:hypothetical protein